MGRCFEKIYMWKSILDIFLEIFLVLQGHTLSASFSQVLSSFRQHTTLYPRAQSGSCTANGINITKVDIHSRHSQIGALRFWKKKTYAVMLKH